MKYPSISRALEIMNTHPGTLDTSWGKSCTDGSLLRCETSADCVPLDNSSMRCIRGVCALDDPSVCYQHSDCKDQNRLCSGDGRCVDGVWQAENTFEDEEIDFEFYTEKCESEPSSAFAVDRYDMYGSSPWQRIPDILEMYGMCSYRNWYEYLEMVDPEAGKGRDNSDGRCGALSNTLGCLPESLDVERALWWDTARPYNSPEMPTLWGSQKFRVQAHPCDRDYMHVRGMAGCAPVVLEDNSAMGIMDMDTREQALKNRRARRTKNAQTIEEFVEEVLDDSSSSFQVRRFLNMVGKPYKQKLKDEVFRSTGFLGTQSADPKEFFDCKSIQQCFVEEFTYHGSAIDRIVTTDTGLDAWVPLHGQRCGSFGIEVDPSRHQVNKHTLISCHAKKQAFI